MSKTLNLNSGKEEEGICPRGRHHTHISGTEALVTSTLPGSETWVCASLLWVSQASVFTWLEGSHQHILRDFKRLEKKASHKMANVSQLDEG